MISVCVATYNGEKYLLNQIQSILKQLNPEDECIIQDDRSTDRTIEIITSFNDARVKLIINKKNVGYQMNFSKAISRAIGDVIFLSDQDDIWLDDKLSKTVDKLQFFDAVISNATIIDGGGLKIGSYFSNSFIKLPNNLKAIYSIFFPRYLGCCMAFKRSCVNKIIPLPIKLGDIPHDYYIGTYLLFFFKTTFANDCLIEYRRHDNNVSNGKAKSKNSLLYKLNYRFKCIVLMVRAHYGK